MSGPVRKRCVDVRYSNENLMISYMSAPFPGRPGFQFLYPNSEAGLTGSLTLRQKAARQTPSRPHFAGIPHRLR